MPRILIIALLALGPLQWITLLDVGLSLKPVHIPYFIAAFLGWFGALRGRQMLEPIRTIMPFALCYSVYLLFLIASVAMNPSGLTEVAKYSIYFVCTLGLLFYFTQMPPGELLGAVVIGGAVASVLFVVVASLTLSTRGISLPQTVWTAITTGDPGMLQFRIFFNLFNESSIVGPEERTGVALRHTLLGFIYIAFLVGLSEAIRSRSAILWLCSMLALVIILLSVSRSLILAVFIALMPLLFHVASRKPRIAISGLLVVFTLGAVAALNLDLGGVGSILAARFGNFAEDGRIGMFDVAMDYINLSPLIGHGAGVEFSHGAVRAHQVHNVLLGAWMQAGLGALIAIIGALVCLLSVYFRSILANFGSASRLCLTGLMILPLFRSQISGGGGNFTLPEWICIALAFALLARSRVALTRGAIVPGVGNRPPMSPVKRARIEF